MGGTLGEKGCGDWAGWAVGYCRSLENALSLPELAPAYRRAVEKCLSDFLRQEKPGDFAVVRPAPGEAFDPALHRVVREAAFPELEDGAVGFCQSWGFRVAGEVFLPAEVCLARGGAAPFLESGWALPGKPSAKADGAVGGRPVERAGAGVVHSGGLAGPSARKPWARAVFAAGSLLCAALVFVAGVLLGTGRAPSGGATASSTPRPVAPAAADARHQTAPARGGGGDGGAGVAQTAVPGGRDIRAAWAEYEVRPGDSPWSIAAEHYGDGRLFGLVVAANRLGSKRLLPGMKVRLPGAALRPEPTVERR